MTGPRTRRVPDQVAGDALAAADAITAGPDHIPAGRGVRGQPGPCGHGPNGGNGHRIPLVAIWPGLLPVSPEGAAGSPADTAFLRSAVLPGRGVRPRYGRKPRLVRSKKNSKSGHLV